MKVAILAGGLGTRLSEETTVKPKPMVEVGGKPMLWHIMNIYAAQGFKEFVVALGYKGEVIKDYFLNYHYHSRSLTVNLGTGKVSTHDGKGEDWIVHLLDTGVDTQTGGRVKRLAEFIGNEPFMLTYGDGIADIDLTDLMEFHRNHGRLVTHALVPSTIEHFHTWLVMLRGCSMAPTVITFLAVAGDWMESGSPPEPSSAPLPALPAPNTKSTGWEPVTSGSASRTAAS